MAPLSGKTVLVVDDDSASRDILRTYLEYIGVNVLDADTAERALFIAEARALDAAIVDVFLPAADGLQLVQSLRCLPGGSKTFIIITTGDIREETRDAGMRAGADLFQLKPTDIHHIRDALADAFLPVT